MAWTLIAQLTSGTLSVATTNRVWWTSSTSGISGFNVVVGTYQAATHISDSSDAHLCTTNHVNNTQYVDSTHVSLNGGASALLSSLTQANAGLKFIFDTSDLGGASVVTQSATFYAYDGTTDTNAMAGVTFQAAESSVTSTWVAANGSGAALSLANQTTATSHNFYLATSVTPTSTGAKTGKVKLVLTYV